MFRSLRFQLPALFLAAIVLAGLVSTAVAVSVSKRYADSRSRRQAFRELGREAAGVTRIYASNAGDPHVSAAELEGATGDRIFYISRARGIDPFPGVLSAYTHLPKRFVNMAAILHGRTLEYAFTPPGQSRSFLAVARPFRLGTSIWGALIVTKPATRLDQRWLPLVWRLLPAFFAGILVAGLLGWYLSR